MFAMMNAARACTWRCKAWRMRRNAHRNAVVYAHEQLQSRAPVRSAGSRNRPHRAAPGDAPRTAAPACAGGGAPDRHGPRTLIDLLAEHAGDAAQQQARQAALLTPVLKSFLTDNGFALASDALQVFGGHGYATGASSNACATRASR